MQVDRNMLMQQAMKMQNQLEEIQKKLADTLYTGNNGGKDGVSVTMNGSGEIQKVEIPDNLMNVEDKEMLQDMIMIAANEALDKANKDKEEKLGSVTGGFNIPGLG